MQLDGGRRPPLNRDRVLRAAVALADEAGIEALSMRSLAEQLGVVPMALYKHVANKEELLDGTSGERIVFGHTHLPFARRSSAADLDLVNPGSVGMPFDGDTRAAYAIMDDRGAVEHLRVEYDHAASAAKVRAFGTDWADVVARRIERATPNV